MGAEKPKEGLVELVAALPGKVFKRDALVLVAAVIAGGAFAVYAQAQGKAAVDAGVEPVRVRVERLEATVQAVQVSQEDMRRLLATKEERDAARFDLLYRTILTRQPQPQAAELAAPLAKDGGP